MQKLRYFRSITKERDGGVHEDSTTPRQIDAIPGGLRAGQEAFQVLRGHFRH